MRKNKYIFLLRMAHYIYLCLFCLINLIPIIWTIGLSFMTNQEITSNKFFLSSNFTNIMGYKKVLSSLPILRYMLNSLIVSISATLISIVAISMGAYVFVKANFPYKEYIYFLFISSLLIPMPALISSVHAVIRFLNLYDNLIGLIIVYVGMNLPLALIIMRASFEKIPNNTEEAAMIDGAGFTKTFVFISLPNVKGGIISASALCFINSWNEFTFALILTSSNKNRTLPLSIRFFTSQYSYDFSSMFSAITLSMIPSIIFFLLLTTNIFNIIQTEVED